MSDEEEDSFIEDEFEEKQQTVENENENEDEDEVEGELSDQDEHDGELSDQDEIGTNKKKKFKKSEFIDDEAELSGDDVVSEDELENSDDDQLDLDLVDQEADELDSEEEEEVRGLYHKQLETEDKRAVLLLQEHFEDKNVSIGQQRRKKFRWQTKELMENSLKRHYDPDDDDSQDYDEDEDDEDYEDLNPRLRRPTAESLLIGSTRLITKTATMEESSVNKSNDESRAVPSHPNVMINEDSNSRSLMQRPSAAVSNIDRFLYRDKELVQALSTKETVIISREERDKNIQKELKRVLTSKSIFDQLYS